MKVYMDEVGQSVFIKNILIYKYIYVLYILKKYKLISIKFIFKKVVIYI